MENVFLTAIQWVSDWRQVILPVVLMVVLAALVNEAIWVFRDIQDEIDGRG